MEQKVAVVTGARRGIGLAIARTLCEAGYFVITCATAPEFELPEDMRQNACYIACDISDGAQRDALFEQVMQEWGRLDVLVNNAGVAPASRMDVLQTTPENFGRVIDVNLTGTFFMCQQAANRMIALQQENIPDYQPRIVNISSISSYTASVNRGEYCISKAGVSMITQLFAARLAECGIGVFEVSPGIIMTDMTAGVKDKYARMIEEGVTPIRRFGQPQDVADCVMAVLSGWMDFATGQVIHADGGFHLRRL